MQCRVHSTMYEGKKGQYQGPIGLRADRMECMNMYTVQFTGHGVD